MGMYRSKEDELAKLSSSIFVMNFPDKFSAKELWTVCKQYGTVVDAFIPDRRSKAVRAQDERHGSIFNAHRADAFNLFISSAGLEEVPLDGCKFAWCHKSGSK
ncbi:nucleotide-binding alpha-beta plait domain-containing protein, partial [Tanacetum coccineum]